VRLRGCVAIELFVGALLTAAVSGAAIWGVAELRAAIAGEPGPLAAARSDGDGSIDPADEAAPEDRSEDGERGGPVLAAASISGDLLPRADASAERWPWSGKFLGRDDESLLAPLRDSPITAVKVNKGGTSLSLRLDFESGGRAACKPTQVHLHSQPRREIAAYRINRLLGLSSVPPAIGRRFRVAELAQRFKPDAIRDRARFLAEVVPERDDKETVHGQLTWWVPDLKQATIDGFDVDSTEGVVTWKRHLTIGTDVAPTARSLAAQVSDMVLFDFIINNSDRWSGGNIKSTQGGRVLVFLDNTLSFGGDTNGHSRVRTYLERSQKFSRRLVERLRKLDEEQLEDVLTRDIDPFEELLEPKEVRALLKRRDHAMRYIDDLIATHGEDAVLAFP
jgi:Golgi casein kinase, C-terminal, Fam20